MFTFFLFWDWDRPLSPRAGDCFRPRVFDRALLSCSATTFRTKVANNTVRFRFAPALKSIPVVGYVTAVVARRLIFLVIGDTSLALLVLVLITALAFAFVDKGSATLCD